MNLRAAAVVRLILLAVAALFFGLFIAIITSFGFGASQGETFAEYFIRFIGF